MSAGAVLSSILAIVLSLAFVIALAWGGLWLLRKFQDGSFGKLNAADGARTLRFERALPVGPRERIVLIEVDGEHMLLGVTAHTITQLKTWPDTGANTGPGSGGSQMSGAGADDARETAAERPRFRLPIADRDRS